MKVTRVVKRLLGAAAIYGMLAIFLAGSASARVIGGYIDTVGRDMVVASDAGILAASASAVKLNGGSTRRTGYLFVRYASGRHYVFRRAFRDAYGVQVTVPTNKFDKVVFLNSSNRIVGGIGLSEDEISAITSVHSDPDLQVASQFVRPERLQDVFDSVSYASESARQASRYSQAVQRAIYSSTVNMMGGRDLQTVMNAILDSAQVDESFPFISIFSGKEEPGLVDILRGVSVVSEGDNGGPGDGYVAEGDNGGPGDGYVAQGLDGSVNGALIPRVSMNALCNGTFLYIY